MFLQKSKKLIKELINLWVKTSNQSEWGIAVQLQEERPENNTCGFHWKPVFLPWLV